MSCYLFGGLFIWWRKTGIESDSVWWIIRSKKDRYQAMNAIRLMLMTSIYDHNQNCANHNQKRVTFSLKYFFRLQILQSKFGTQSGNSGQKRCSNSNLVHCVLIDDYCEHFKYRFTHVSIISWSVCCWEPESTRFSTSKVRCSTNGVTMMCQFSCWKR